MSAAALMTQAEEHRSELQSYCRRLLGPSDAEDAVQETLLRAWRAGDRFQGRAALRTWLYRIATNVCSDMATRRARLGTPTDSCPDSPGDDALDPAQVVIAREDVRLALLAAVASLPPRQRAVLFLRDVLSWRAAEVAELLGTSTAAVNSALQRARAVVDRSDPEMLVACASLLARVSPAPQPVIS